MKQPKTHIVLMHEDPVEARSVLAYLDNHHIDFSVRWLSDTDELERVLRFEKFQLVLLGYHAPRVGVDRGAARFLSALRKIRDAKADLPVIIVTREISVELFTECVKYGISDLILLQQLERLTTSITKASQLHEARRKAFDATKALAERELHFQVLFEGSPQGIMIYTKCDSGYACEFINHAFKSMFEMETVDTLYQGDAFAFVEHKGRERIRKIFADAVNGVLPTKYIEFKAHTERGKQRYCQATIQLISWHGKPAIQASILDVTESKYAERDILLRERALASIGNGIFIFKPNALSSELLYCNAAFEALTGYGFAEIAGKDCPVITDVLARESKESGKLADALGKGLPYKTVIKQRRKNGSIFWNEMLLSPVVTDTGDELHYVGVVNDVTEAKQDMSRQAQHQKLESIGQLAAGIAHEINTPTQYVGDNIHFLRDSFQDLQPLLLKLSACVDALQGASDGVPADTFQEIQELKQNIEFDYLLNEIPLSLEQAQDGVQRIAAIVQAMKAFSHPDSVQKVPADLNDLIANTIIVCRNEWKYLAEMKTEFCETLPTLTCYPQELSQVVLNLIVNAAHAIEEKQEKQNRQTVSRGEILVKTRAVKGRVEILVADDGCGISAEAKDRIFDPFYTTKRVGKGTGQGLSMAHATVVERHQGEIIVQSKPGIGTTFTVSLPVFNSIGLEEELNAEHTVRG